MTIRLGFCRFCQSKNYGTLFIKDDYAVAKCRDCDFVFLDFSPSQKFLEEYYSENFFLDPGLKHGFNDYEKESQSLLKTFRERVKTIREFKPSGRLLDVGAATGTFLEAAAPVWRGVGVEISSYASGIAREKGLDVYCGDLKDLPFANQKFDVLTLWDTLEHLTDPQETLRSLATLANPGAILALTTGDVDSLLAKVSGQHWHLFNIPQHLSFFDRASVTGLLENHGFKVRKISYPGLNFTLDYLLFRLLTFYKIKSLLPLYQKVMERGWLNLKLKINLRDIMFIIAQKTQV